MIRYAHSPGVAFTVVSILHVARQQTGSLWATGSKKNPKPEMISPNANHRRKQERLLDSVIARSCSIASLFFFKISLFSGDKTNRVLFNLSRLWGLGLHLPTRKAIG